MSIKGGIKLVTIVISEVNNRYLQRIQNRRGCSKHEQVLKKRFVYFDNLTERSSFCRYEIHRHDMSGGANHSHRGNWKFLD